MSSFLEYSHTMISVPLALAALALAGVAPANASAPQPVPALVNAPAKTHGSAKTTAKAKTATKASPKTPAKSAASAAEAEQAGGADELGTDKRDSGEQPADQEPAFVAEFSDAAALVSRWIASSGDNGPLPYIIVDKPAARAYLFDASGKPLADAPVLIGKALGDDATPGVGAKSLSEIGPAEKTTPAGRFLAKFGLAAGNQKVLWVDYTTSVALHTIPVGNKENRRARMLSKTIDDNRITFGCINVPKAFYGKGVVPLFQKKGGYVYVLPDSKALEDVFPRVRVQAVLEASQD